MLKSFNKKKKDNKGFTLVELVIVVAILAILVGILAPQYTKYVEKSRQSADVSNLENIVKGFKVAAADTDYNVIPAGEDIATYTITMTATGTTIAADKAPAKDADKNNIIPVIVEGTKVTYTDINNKKHMNESLGSGMLEKLPYFEEYALMQTQDLFRYVHDMVCNEETLKKNLKSIFK